ncbi:MAG: ComF family protein [Bacteroidota bacterium]|nr:ComF family protein [Bacteroidota bacterium]
MKANFFITDLLGLLFPRLCHSCGQALFMHEQALCTACLYQLPETKFHLDPESLADQVFWGRIKIEKASAYYFYVKNGRVQKLVHQLKYQGKKEIGIYIGEIYGRDLTEAPLYQKLNLIIPVPLHPKKMRLRGFNQSEIFARGLAKSMNVPVNTKILYRTKASQTQTRKSRFGRWKNVENIFTTRDDKALKNKNILLVDDVITTGSTIEACAHALLKAEGVKVWVVAMAFAS